MLYTINTICDSRTEENIYSAWINMPPFRGYIARHINYL